MITLKVYLTSDFGDIWPEHLALRHFVNPPFHLKSLKLRCHKYKKVIAGKPTNEWRQKSTSSLLLRITLAKFHDFAEGTFPLIFLTCGQRAYPSASEGASCSVRAAWSLCCNRRIWNNFKRRFDSVSMEQHNLRNVNTCLNTNIYSYLATSGDQSYNVYLNVVHFFNTTVNWTSVPAWDSCFPALVSNTCCSIPSKFCYS
jgi:hypothetical protein